MLEKQLENMLKNDCKQFFFNFLFKTTIISEYQNKVRTDIN